MREVTCPMLFSRLGVACNTVVTITSYKCDKDTAYIIVVPVYAVAQKSCCLVVYVSHIWGMHKTIVAFMIKS